MDNNTGQRIIVTGGAGFIGSALVVALGSPKEYTSQVRLLPESQQQSSLGGLGGLARQFGIPGGAQQTADGIPATLYPDITQSTVFLHRLLYYDVALPDPVIAADVADEVVRLLSEHITDYRTEKVRRDAEFIEKRHTEAQERFEEARIKLQEETPVVNILEPAAVPDRRSEPRRGRLLVMCTVFGTIVGIGFIFGLQFWNILRKKL